MLFRLEPLNFSTRTKTPRHWTGRYLAQHAWWLPGVTCPTCGETWSGGTALPSIDFSGLTVRPELETPRVVPYAEYERLADLVRPLLPADVHPEPGMQFGPLRGTASGDFGPLTVQVPWEILVRGDALEQLHAAGIRGLIPVRADLHALGGPELYELEPPLSSRIHSDCVRDVGTPCRTCGWYASELLTDPWLDGGAIPSHLDIFRPPNAITCTVVSARFVDAVRSLGPSDVAFIPIGTEPEAQPGPPP